MGRTAPHLAGFPHTGECGGLHGGHHFRHGLPGMRGKNGAGIRFAALCLLLIFAAVGAAVWLWAGRGLSGRDVEVPDYVQASSP